MIIKLIWLFFFLQVIYGQEDYDDMPKIQKGPVLVDDMGNLFIKAVVKIGCPTNRIRTVSQNGIEVDLKSRHLDETANHEFLSFMTEVLRIGRKDIAIFLGDEEINKVLIIRSHRISQITARNLLFDAKG